MPENKRPNLFEYATKELSQDAIICWLIHWADDRCADIDWGLHRCGRRFVGALLDKHGVACPPEEITSTIRRQDRGIDVLAKLNDEHVLLIEDKTGTEDDRNKLKDYYNEVIEGHTQLGNIAQESVYPIYLKTHTQSRSNGRGIERSTEDLHRSFRVFIRSDFLKVLRSYGGTHQSLIDFRVYLERKESDLNAFRGWKQDQQIEWSDESWKGFYLFLEDVFCGSDWSWVNPQGGGRFLGFWWNKINVEEAGGPNVYLQLEVIPGQEGKLCFKVYSPTQERQQELRDHWCTQIIEAGEEHVRRPDRMGRGGTMTVALWAGEWLAFADGRIDLPRTVDNLKEAERILQGAAN